MDNRTRNLSILYKMSLKGENKIHRGVEIIEVVMTENFSRLIPDTKSQIQKAQRAPKSINAPKNLHLGMLY